MPKLFHVRPCSVDPDQFLKTDAIDGLAEQHGWQSDRLKYKTLGQLIDVADLARRISDSNLVVADLSFERPSCYFELGIAAALDIPILILVDTAARLHQRPPGAPVLRYSNLAEFELLLGHALTEFPIVVH